MNSKVKSQFELAFAHYIQPRVKAENPYRTLEDKPAKPAYKSTNKATAFEHAAANYHGLEFVGKDEKSRRQQAIDQFSKPLGYRLTLPQGR